MTETRSTELESTVIGLLEQMLAKYQSLEALTDSMLAKHRQGQPIETEIQQMHRERELLTELELQSQPVNEAYRSSRQHASKTVQDLTTKTTALIQNVIGKIGELEDAARKSYQQLVPEIDREVRGNQMKRAYGNSSS